ncbi:MAG: hypothetical protein ACHQWU_04965 [Gemmatimonadales bacterium]
MPLRINTALANKMLDNVLNSGAGISALDSGVAEFRTGAQPASADSAATGTIVSTVALAADAFAAASARVCAKNGTLEDTSADNTGTIGWVRFRDAADTYRLDADVTITGGGGTVTVDNPALVASQDFLVTSCNITA